MRSKVGGLYSMMRMSDRGETFQVSHQPNEPVEEQPSVLNPAEALNNNIAEIRVRLCVTVTGVT